MVPGTGARGNLSLKPRSGGPGGRPAVDCIFQNKEKELTISALTCLYADGKTRFHICAALSGSFRGGHKNPHHARSLKLTCIPEPSPGDDQPAQVGINRDER